jgi:DNA-binding PadR family transcriptional regulator
VTKNIVEITGRAYGTVRSSLHRFEELGYIEPNQRIGRSELYVPTDKMKKTVNEFAAISGTASPNRGARAAVPKTRLR